jgi:hypothetical protein
MRFSQSSAWKMRAVCSPKRATSVASEASETSSDSMKKGTLSGTLVPSHCERMGVEAVECKETHLQHGRKGHSTAIDTPRPIQSKKTKALKLQHGPWRGWRCNWGRRYSACAASIRASRLQSNRRTNVWLRQGANRQLRAPVCTHACPGR